MNKKEIEKKILNNISKSVEETQEFIKGNKNIIEKEKSEMIGKAAAKAAILAIKEISKEKNKK